jgi:tetratricopeptide (TPR) repeat protein
MSQKTKKFILLAVILFLIGISLFFLLGKLSIKSVNLENEAKSEEMAGNGLTEREKCIMEIKNETEGISGLIAGMRYDEAMSSYEKIEKDNCLIATKDDESSEFFNRSQSFTLIFGGINGMDSVNKYPSIYFILGKDREALSLYKKIASVDTTILGSGIVSNEKAKAKSFASLAELSVMYPESFLKENIFNDYPLVLDYNTNDFWENFKLLNEKGFRQHEIMLADFALADYYSNKALAYEKDSSGYKENLENFFKFNRKGEYFYYDQEYTSEGKNYGKGIDNFIEFFEPENLISIYLHKAKINDRLKGQGIEIEHSLSNDEIEDLFKKAMELTKNPFVAQMPERYEHFVRFYYATFLNNAYGMARETDIKNLLEPIYEMSGNEERGIFVFLQKEKNYNDNYPHKKEILELAKIDTKMSEMLLVAGWELE